MAINPLSDEYELLQRLRKDDHVAFTRLYGHYWKPMLLVARNHTKDKTLAEDIVHEVFMTLWEKRNELHIHSVAGFLATAVKFSVFKHYQKEKRRRELDSLLPTHTLIINDEAKLDALFLSEYLAGLVEELPEKCQIVFRHSREGGLKNAEIAELLQVSEKAVEANLTRALKTLRKRMKDGGFVDFITSVTDILKINHSGYRVIARSPYPVYEASSKRWIKSGYINLLRRFITEKSVKLKRTNSSNGIGAIAT